VNPKNNLTPGRLVRTCFALLALHLPVLALAQANKLAGTWQMFNEQQFKFDRNATITAAGARIIVDNGAGLVGPADVNGNLITVLGLQTGTVSANGDLITWSNGYKWVRQGSSVSVAPPAIVDLAGEWTALSADGRKAPRAARVTQRGETLSFDNGDGSASAGKIAGRRVEATAWGVTGEISVDDKRIAWSNNTTWRRRTEADIQEAARAALPREVRAFSKGRLIEFRNEAGYVAEMQISYVLAAGNQAATQSSGKLAFTETKSLTIPETAANTKITIRIVGSATTNDRFFTTTVNGDDDFPKQCFKAWGTLFSPQGGKC
jgi:hypothetical protein